jgi:hypothetical protein
MVKHNKLNPVGEKTSYLTEEQTRNATALQLKQLFRCYNNIKDLGNINV